jgi:hypothetical protein
MLKLLANASPRERIVRILMLILGGGVGGGLGYLIGDTVAYQLYRLDGIDLSEEEKQELEYRKEMKKRAIDLADEYSWSTDVTEPNTEVVQSAVEKEKKLVTNYAEKFKQTHGLVKPKQEESVEDWSHISFISEEEFEDNEDGLVVIQLSYYEEDDVVTDSNDKVIKSPDDILGPDALTKFGEGTGDPDMCYVRNDLNEAMYEVVRIHGAYDNIILGNKKKPKPKARKPKVVKQPPLEDDED